MVHQLADDIPSPPERRYRQALTWASVVAFVSIFNAFWVWIPSWEGVGRLLGLLILLPFLLPYAFIPLRLHTRRFTSGFRLAIAVGCALFVPGIYLIRFVHTWDKRWWIFGNLILALLMQPVLTAIAAHVLISMPRVPYGRIKLLGSLVYGFLLFGLFWCFYSPVPRYITANEGSAMRYLSAAATSAFLDALQEHSNSYPMAIAGWAPVPNPRCAMDNPWVIPPGNPADGYFFEYTGNPPSTTVEGCTRFQSFTMTARPVVFERTGIRSFFVDKSREIHATSENRAANASDPVDDTLLRTHRPQ